MLGAGTALQTATHGSAGFAVGVGGTWWLIDGGSGTLQRLARAGLEPSALAGGLYTHRHPDHTGDLVPLLFAFRVGGRKGRYPLVGGEGLAGFVEGLRGVYGHWLPEPKKIPVVELPLGAPGELELLAEGPARARSPRPALHLRHAPANHGAGALHLSLEAAGQRVVFSGDTAWSEPLVALATGADLLVVECAGADGRPVPGHLTPAEVLQVVQRARPAEVWVTHLYPAVDPEEVRATVARAGVPVHLPADLDRWSGPAQAAVRSPTAPG